MAAHLLDQQMINKCPRDMIHHDTNSQPMGGWAEPGRVILRSQGSTCAGQWFFLAPPEASIPVGRRRTALPGLVAGPNDNG